MQVSFTELSGSWKLFRKKTRGGSPQELPVPNWVKALLGFVLLPFCFGAVMALGQIVRATSNADTFWVALLGGAACWIVVYLLLPKPMRVYVLGHELTHALWTWLFGGRVKRFKAGSRGGYVVLSKSNSLIALAPYFFPLYAALVVLGFGLGHLIWGWSRHLAWLHLFAGAAYAFHVTLTLHILKTRQSDITGEGYFFSAIIIFLGNALVLLVGIPMLSARVPVLTALGWWLTETGQVLLRLRHWI